MAPLLPEPDISKLEHIATLQKFRDKLLTPGLRERFECPFFISRKGDYCKNDCQFYYINHPTNFRRASNYIKKHVDDVEKDDFIAVLRTFFCGEHDLKEK